MTSHNQQESDPVIVLRFCVSPLGKPINPKGNQPWIFIGRTDAEAETPVFWSSVVNSWLIGKVPDAGKDWGQKRASEDEMAGWHHWCNVHELGQTLGDGKGQGGLGCSSPWGCKESDVTGRLNNNSKWKVKLLTVQSTRRKLSERWKIFTKK